MYPSFLEDWWLARASKSLAINDTRGALQALERDAGRLSDLFTTERRTDFGDYTAEARLLLAYGLYYFPQTFVRTGFPLQRIQAHIAGWKDEAARPLRVLDLGAGTGAALLAAVNHLQQLMPDRAIEAHALEPSGASLALLRELTTDLRAHWPDARFVLHQGDMRDEHAIPRGPWDLILASFSLGEAFFGSSAEVVEGWLDGLGRKLADKGLLLVLEPALRETSERLEALRDGLAAGTRWQVLAPCPHAAPCPLRAGGEHWCHEVRRWQPPESLLYLNRHLHRSVETLKYSYLLLAEGSHKRPPMPSRWRLISPLAELKGRFIAAVCAPDGRRYTLEVPTRALKKAGKKELARWERGALLELRNAHPLGDGATLRVQPEDLVRVED